MALFLGKRKNADLKGGLSDLPHLPADVGAIMRPPPGDVLHCLVRTLDGPLKVRRARGHSENAPTVSH